MSGDIMSITFFLSASSAVTETLFLTESTAHSAFLPLSFAMLSIKDDAKFSIFSFITSEDLSSFFSSGFFPGPLWPPPSITGWAAPMLVPGDMAATWAESVMKTPAEVAVAPLG